MWQTYYQPTTLSEALELMQQHAGQSRLVAGGTDLMVELQRGIRPTSTVIDITRIGELKYVRSENGQLQLGALATHNDVISSPLCVVHGLPLAQASWQVGAPQIRTRATVAGNLVTASPANDTITPLMALAAEVVLVSSAGERVVPLHAFYTGVRRTVLAQGELLREIRFPALADNQRGIFLKLGLRRAQAISVVNLAIVLTFDFDGLTVADARIALGCVAPTIMRASEAESFLVGKTLNEVVCQEAGQLACRAATPIDDLRGSARYRLATLAALVTQGLQQIATGTEGDGWPETLVLLETAVGNRQSAIGSPQSAVDTITTRINGQEYQLRPRPGKTLLDALRDDAELTGTKEGCAEGECGACTVWLDGQAVMSCLVPAPQAEGAEITTIEGLRPVGSRQSAVGSEETQKAEGEEPTGHPASFSQLHPLQRAFIEHGAVQCGYCIPGMLMAGAKLLDEHPNADLAQAQMALSGNICRCTGYRKIFDAVLAASESQRNT